MRLLTNKLAHSANETSEYSKKFWLMMSAFYALFIVRSILHVNLPMVAFLAMVAVMAFMFDEHEIKALVISFIPLGTGFQYKYAILICVFMLLIKYFTKLKITYVAIWGSFVIAWELLHLAIGTSSIIEFVRGFAELVFIMLVTCLPSRKKSNVTALVRVLVISCAVAFLVLLFTTLEATRQDIFEFMKSGARLGEAGIDTTVAFSFTYNPNELGFICNLSIATLLINIYQKRATIIEYALIPVFVFVGCLSISRTFLFCLAISIILYIIMQDTTVLKKAGAVGIIAIVALIIFWIVAVQFPNIIENYTDRFDVDDITNGRSELFEMYNRFIFSSPDKLFFGIGIQNIAEKASSIMGIAVLVPHNGYQELVVAWGIPGLVLMVLFVVSLIRRAQAQFNKATLMQYLPIVLLMVNILAGQFFTVSSKMLSLVLIYELLRASAPQIERDENEQ